MIKSFFIMSLMYISISSMGCAHKIQRLEAINFNHAQQKMALCSPTSPPEQWAVVVGIDNYQDQNISPLNGATHDAWTFYHYLASAQGGKVKESRRIILLNWQATRANLERAFGQFLAKACPQDTIYIYFAGHGTPEPDRNSEAFLLTYDTRLDNLVGTAISMRQLPRFLSWRAGRAGRLMMFVDACHSGQLKFPWQRGVKMDQLTDQQGFSSDRSKEVHKQLSSISQQEPNWSMFTAASSTQVAVEARESCSFSKWRYKGGLFTCSILNALSGRADQDKDGQVAPPELYKFVAAEVQEQSKGNQRPQWIGKGWGFDLKLAQKTPSTTQTKKNKHFTELPPPLPVIQKQITIPQIPSFLVQKPRRGPSNTTWSLIASTVIGAVISTVMVRDTNSLANEIEQSSLGFSSYELDREQRLTYQSQKENSMWALGVTGGLALTSLSFWLYDYLSQRRHKDKVWFHLRPQ